MKLRSLLGVLMLFSAAPEMDAQGARRNTYVVIPGAWGGGFAWQKMDSLLSARGHRLVRVTLTGLGERVHLASPDIGLDTHIRDVVNVLEWEKLEDVILIGHSYGGMVATGVYAAVPNRIRSVVYLDALLPDSGHAALDLMSPGLAKLVRSNVKDGMVIPVWMPATAPLPKDMPHPLKTFTDTLHFDPAILRKMRATYILTYDPANQPDAFERDAQRAAGRGWKVERMIGDHVPYRSKPLELLQLLINLD